MRTSSELTVTNSLSRGGADGAIGALDTGGGVGPVDGAIVVGGAGAFGGRHRPAPRVGLVGARVVGPEAIEHAFSLAAAR